jgi:peptidoglycan/xylan/chitin deacetylase (PgdA/CDA1 family)
MAHPHIRPVRWLIFVFGRHHAYMPFTDLLNYLDSQNLHTTFFIVGSRAISRPDILQAEFMSGHQVCRHRQCCSGVDPTE